MLPRLPSAIPLSLGQSQVRGANPPAIPGNRGHPPGYHSSIPPCHPGSAWPPQLTPYPGVYTEGLGAEAHPCLLGSAHGDVGAASHLQLALCFITYFCQEERSKRRAAAAFEVNLVLCGCWALGRAHRRLC